VVSVRAAGQHYKRVWPENHYFGNQPETQFSTLQESPDDFLFGIRRQAEARNLCLEFYIESTSRCLQHGWKSYAKSHIQNFPVVLSGVLE